ncbi:SDR family NAD(P)-dependent oxidoreductase [Microvirga antarctica]|uniref:SDR family NAD(P)-dependent oxidoreductase n=1 Tax=Microvirga antarctica TaxID=2819233 RepID=UPI001B313763|nr:SDR family NAD(P)-dependent oxidoreductase [Microvirga antarctica]
MANISDGRLAGKMALVTGAAQGLGLAIARSFLEAGATVALTDVNEQVSAVARELDPTGKRASGYVLDVRSESAWTAVYDKVGAALGPIDILVNNAAMTISKSVWDIPADEWDDVMAVNLRGVFFGCRVAGRHMRERGKGRIINLSSLAGQRGGVVAGAHYSASKAGIIVLTKCFAQELAGKGVTVNAIAPAAIEGPMTKEMPAEKVQGLAKTIPVGRLGSDTEVGAAAVYLAADDAGFVTGATLDVNGGVFMR